MYHQRIETVRLSKAINQEDEEMPNTHRLLWFIDGMASELGDRGAILLPATLPGGWLGTDMKLPTTGNMLGRPNTRMAGTS